MSNKFKTLALSTLIAMTPLSKAVAQDNKNPTEFKFGYNKEAYKNAMENTKFYYYGETIDTVYSDDIEGKDIKALVEYLANDTIMLAALRDELILINREATEETWPVGAKINFLLNDQAIPEFSEGPLSISEDGECYFIVVTEENKEEIYSKMAKGILDCYQVAAIRINYHSAVLNGQRVGGYQMVEVARQASRKVEKKRKELEMYKKQLEIVKKYRLPGTKNK
jgi:hypothetical protein